ncbi:GGDEF domain-containing protein [Deinococcus arenicola]|uniref:GGDEF domain-containing protein n=1 Tax=Deinococcus arenicola TaxID=2994950 RepID=A0ABU4DQ79_9DEIO|nr:GGDEF domain-containing protein [Deinococcus sp. ZS9-10]MDV6374589.1 GGDEF domain-containing protein [Deinococcus sp. ZS9-10]
MQAALGTALLSGGLYVLLAFNHQFMVMPANHRMLSENTYWFAVWYATVFLAYSPRRAPVLAGSVLGAATLIAVWHLIFTVPATSRPDIIGAVVQFLLTGGVLILLQATFGVQRAMLLASRSSALRDVLTGIANRRAAEEHLRALSSQGTAYRVVLFDLDHFKQINDTYGHATGDLVLRGVARLTQATLPTGGLVARWGGEEFLVVLPMLGDAEITKILNDVRNEFCQQRYGEVLGVTASFGVATATALDHPDEVVARADKAMYSAKQQGRNDICIAKPPC